MFLDWGTLHDRIDGSAVGSFTRTNEFQKDHARFGNGWLRKMKEENDQ